MAYQVVWSSEALKDVDAIAEYISRDSPAYAATVVKKILQSTHNLAQRPFLGRIVPEMEQEEIRECFVFSYRIIYRLRQTTITVAAVIHGRQLAGSILNDRIADA